MAIKKRSKSKIRKCKPKKVLEDRDMEKDQGLGRIKPGINEKSRKKMNKSRKNGFKAKDNNCIGTKLQWKPVPVNYGIDFEGFGGIEELTNYKAEKAESPKTKKRKQNSDDDDDSDDFDANKGKPKRKKPRSKSREKKNKGKQFPLNPASEFRLIHSPEYVAKMKGQLTNKKRELEDSDEEDIKDEIEEVDMSRWDDLFIPQEVLRALKEMKFVAPTPIQAYTLPSAIRDRMDILGAAETGSGKTLAFAIPIIHGILRDKTKENSKPKDIQSDENRSDVESSEHSQNDSDGEQEDSDVEQEDSDVEQEDSDVEQEDSDEEQEDSDEEQEDSDGEQEDSDEEQEDSDEEQEISDEEQEDSDVEQEISDGEQEISDGEQEISDGEQEISDGEQEISDGEQEDSDGEQEDSDVEQEDSDVEQEDSDVEQEDSDGEQEISEQDSEKVIEDLNIDDFNDEILPTNPETNGKPFRALILTPTRELAIQVQKHIQAISKYTDIRVAVVVGGMSVEKQVRILSKNPEIVVATPGRLWELLQEGNEHLNQVTDVKYLVIDEADRMVEKGHFEELGKILDLMRNHKDNRQNFIFSATLTMVHNTPKRLLLKKKKYKLTQKIKLDSIMEMVGMKDKPKVVDITKKFGTADTLTEAKLFCNVEDKDAYLYYFRLTYPGRTLVFCNSIDCVRRLQNVFQNLKCQSVALHSSMAQRQRLKNLDRFRNNSQSLLLSTDVAARGLDIQNIQHVIHYHVPKTAETYVHRSGRTARASSEGLSLMLLSPQEITIYRKLCRTLNRDKDLPDFPVNQDVISMVHERVNLARKLDVLTHRLRKKSSQSNWLLQTAEKMDIDIEDGDLRSEVDESLKQNKQDSNVIKRLQKDLDVLLKKPVAPRGSFTRYPTQTGRLKTAETVSNVNSAIQNVGKQIPWETYEEKVNNNEGKLKKVKKNKKKYWKPKKNVTGN